MLACLRVLFGRCRREGMALVGELSGVTAASCLQYLALLIGEGFPQGIRDVQIVINQPMDACRGRQQALKAILHLLTRVGRSFTTRIDSDLSDCSEG